ncbi:MAG TPA: RluA family pseudouridine synthase, partial [Waddliaceae bacterium]
MLKIIYEDNHLLVVEKPSGLPTQPSEHSDDSLEEQAKHWMKTKYNKRGQVFLHAVHRLDKDASGIVVFSKTSKALSRLNDAIRKKLVSKLYLAWVEGTPPLKEGTLENFLLHDDFKANVVSATAKGAKVARMHYRIIKKKEKQTLLEIDLETGRYHQIRIQLAAVGCPIVGDVKYGSKQRFWHEGIALHHAKMCLPHPVSGEMLTFESPDHQQ